MLQSTQVMPGTDLPELGMPPRISVIMPRGMIGFDGINHYRLTPLFPDKEAWLYWRLTAFDFQEEDSVATDEDDLFCPKPGTLSFILLTLEDLTIGGTAIQRHDIDSNLKPLGIKYEECIVFVVISIETNEQGKLSNMTANIKAPVIYHPETKQAWQIILSEGSYPISLPLMGG